MATEKKTTAKRARGKGANAPPAQGQEAERQARRRLIVLDSAQQAWANFGRFSQPGRERDRGLAVARIVKAAFDAYIAEDDAELDRLGKAARRSLRSTLRRWEEQQSPNGMVRVDGPNGPSLHTLGDIVATKGASGGRYDAIRGKLNTLEWMHEKGQLNADSYANWMLLMLRSPFFDFFDVIRDRRILEAPRVRDKLRLSFDREYNASRPLDCERLFVIGLRTLGVSSQVAHNLLKAEDMRAKRGKGTD
ncbi:MAG: hypothetical protein JW940_29815 [Polyangiaceae bacterium]|nr:hypothetical protein [Polyangiaceae bacterium]